MSEQTPSKILVVDDDAGIRMTLRASLRRAGYRVFEAGSGELALDMFDLEPPHLVLLDIVMPGMSGFETCAAIKERFPQLETPIIMLTGLDDTEAVRSAYEYGAADFVTKPINYQLLNYRIDHVLRAHDDALELRQVRRRQDHAQRIANLGHMEWDSQSNVSYCSEGMGRILGLEEPCRLETLDQLYQVLGKVQADRVRLLLESTLAAGGRNFRLEHELLDRGQRRCLLHNAELVYDANDQLEKVVATFQDLTHLRETEEQLHRLAFYDTLTGLPKRQMLLEFLAKEVERAKRYQRHLVVLVIGMDGLSRYRDVLGHQAAEELIRQFAERLKAYCRASDFLSSGRARPDALMATTGSPPSRVGEDEFVITLSQIPEPEDSRVLLRRIRESLGDLFVVNGHEISVTASMGVGVYPLDATTPEDLLRAAELALNGAREQGPDTQQYYTESLNERVLNQFSLENELRRALEHGDLRVYYQPKQSLVNNEVVSAEALARWPHPERGFVPPLEFIGVAERAGLIDALGDWVLWTVCRDLKDLAGALPVLPSIAVNVSPVQFRRVDLVARIRQIVELSGIDSQSIEFEITENTLMHDIDRGIALIRSIRDLGCTIAIDDFGTGYSSLSYLKRMPAQVLKIDRSFVRDLPASAQDRAIVQGIVGLGHSLSMQVVAEGVEHIEQKRFLADIGCDLMQGFLLSPAVPGEELQSMFGGQGPAPDMEASLA